MNSPRTDAIEHFVAKWQRREPEMAQAEVFCPPALRQRYRAWGALLHELREAAFELSDARVAEVKGQWWAEELLGLAEGRSRHPVTAPLREVTAPWQALVHALLALPQHDARPGDTPAALARLAPLAAAIAATEAGVFDARPAPQDADAVAVHLLLFRLPEGLASDDQAGLPMRLLARHGLSAAEVAAGQGDALLRDWAAELLAASPPADTHDSQFRRLRTGFDRARLARLAKGRGFDPPGPFATLLRAWRLARRP
ncbi:hypothetical protein [Arenimonas donghaensis]|uniref:Phytoene synthase n=1 Tax=Arenimonas donghaensis DSM 18148 = HO3-R19 TaxID=1121014 RepID=A0A087ML81_9GAMM|nr:hypothetical protein [Arenimonas donghaensis]KFL37634.1 hypothetical protein N788_00260 [Arenimonas donghaensis DSM 18148 = HO3-R19]